MTVTTPVSSHAMGTALSLLGQNQEGPGASSFRLGGDEWAVVVTVSSNQSSHTSPKVSNV
jgi:hypothetical protein